MLSQSERTLSTNYPFRSFNYTCYYSLVWIFGEHFQPSHFFSWTFIFIDRKSASELLFIVNFAKFWRDAFRETFGIQTSSCAILIRRHPQRPLKHTTMHDARLTTILARRLGSLRYFKTNFVVFNSRTLLPLSHNSMLKFSKFLLTCF